MTLPPLAVYMQGQGVKFKIHVLCTSPKFTKIQSPLVFGQIVQPNFFCLNFYFIVFLLNITDTVDTSDGRRASVGWCTGGTVSLRQVKFI
jgi:hypothetical protein